MEQLLYFSLNKETLRSFHNYVKKNRYEYVCSFRLVPLAESNFSHVSDLEDYLNHQKKLSHIKVIIDYVSLTCLQKPDTIKDAQESIRRLILKYPEVFFLFDETGASEFDFTDFLFPACEEVVNRFLFKEYHQFRTYPNSWGDLQSAKDKNSVAKIKKLMVREVSESLNGITLLDYMKETLGEKDDGVVKGLIKDGHVLANGQIEMKIDRLLKKDDRVTILPYSISLFNPFIVFDRARNNLFDGSNLRYVTKRCLYGNLKVGKHNFGIIQGSRAKNLALCVEEEDGQSRFNCYSLFVNGFRALPVLSAEELKYFNAIHDKLRPTIVTRDYDLQFDDIKQPAHHSEYNEVDWVRGYKYNESCRTWKELTTGDNNYWGNLKKYPICFITKGPDSMSVKLNNPQEPHIEETEKGNILHVQGFHKPVPGIYTFFQKFPTIHETASNVFTCFNRNWLFRRDVAHRIFSETFDHLEGNIGMQKNIIELYKSVVESHESDSPLKYRITKSAIPEDHIWYHQIYSIKTGRADHDHGVPLNVYDMVKDMVDRAKQYYADEKYTRAAIMAWEAIEVMNGFHEALTLKAYHIFALSDNAIAMNVLGGKEEELTEDTQFRAHRIRSDINRILYRLQENDERRKFAKNALIQIFNDCRAFCKQKEHYGSEGVFISALGHLNDADPTWLWLLKMRRMFWDWYDGGKYKRQLKKLENKKS